MNNYFFDALFLFLFLIENNIIILMFDLVFCFLFLYKINILFQICLPSLIRFILMENKNYIHIQNPSLLTNNSNIDRKISSRSFIISTPIYSTTSSLDQTRSNKFYSDKIIITQPTVKYRKIRI